MVDDKMNQREFIRGFKQLWDWYGWMFDRDKVLDRIEKTGCMFWCNDCIFDSNDDPDICLCCGLKFVDGSLYRECCDYFSDKVEFKLGRLEKIKKLERDYIIKESET